MWQMICVVLAHLAFLRVSKGFCRTKLCTVILVRLTTPRQATTIPINARRTVKANMVCPHPVSYWVGRIPLERFSFVRILNLCYFFCRKHLARPSSLRSLLLTQHTLQGKYGGPICCSSGGSGESKEFGADRPTR